jgi:hypothetical protein
MRKPAAALTSLAWFAAVGGTFGTPATARRRRRCCRARQGRPAPGVVLPSPAPAG